MELQGIDGDTTVPDVENWQVLNHMFDTQLEARTH
jgi:hypothetical protein